MYLKRSLGCALLAAFLMGTSADSAQAANGGKSATVSARDTNWREVLELPALPEEGANAFPRWMLALQTLPKFSMLESAVLQSVPDEAPEEAVLKQFRTLVRRCAPALDKFKVEPGEHAALPPGYGMGRGLPGPEEWEALARLKSLQVRVSWWSGHRATAASAAVDLVRAGMTAARDATQLRDWMVWMQLATQGFASARWIAQQIDVTDDELATLSRGLGDATGAWPDGAVRALQGEFAFSFRAAVDHVPETGDIVALSTPWPISVSRACLTPLRRNNSSPSTSPCWIARRPTRCTGRRSPASFTRSRKNRSGSMRCSVRSSIAAVSCGSPT